MIIAEATLFDEHSVNIHNFIHRYSGINKSTQIDY